MRQGKEVRKTNETDVSVTLYLDGTGQRDIDTGIGFLDHMLELFAWHGRFDLTVRCKGDLRVDGHHTTEDIGIVLGKLIARLLGDKKGIERYAAAYVPMDESLARVVVDVSGRPYLKFNGDLRGRIGDYDGELTEEFFRAVAFNAGLTLHVDILDGYNRHHMTEAVFKAFARALKSAVAVTGTAVPSSKGVLE